MSLFIRSLAALACLGASAAQANDIFVGGAGCNYSSIPVALGAANDGDRVFVVATTFNRHLSITKSVQLIGTDACGDSNPPPRSAPWVTIDGSGGTDQPTLGISGTHDVTISGFEFTRGHAASNGYGGGIYFGGNGGSLTLSNVVFDNNSAYRGGGLAISPVGSSVPNIYLKDDVQFFLNRSSDAGGGMYVGGHAEVFVTGKRDVFLLNTAVASGGGIFVLGPAHVALGSPGLNGLLLGENTAQNGGGIAAFASDEANPSDPMKDQLISLFALDAQSPGQIAGNHALGFGGGIYLQSDFGTYNQAQLCAQDFLINGNYALDGAAIYVDKDSDFFGDTLGSDAFLNSGACRSAADLGAVHCAAGVACNLINSNETVDANFHPAGGSTITVAEYALFYASHFAMHGNKADHLFATVDHGDTYASQLFLSTCATGGNILQRELIRLMGERNTLSIKHCTLAPDIIGAPQVINFDNPAYSGDEGALTLLYDIIDEPGTLTLHYPGPLDINTGLFNMGWIVSNDISTLLSGPNIVQGEPLFVDENNADPTKRDFHLRAYTQNGHVTSSPGIDFAPATGGSGLDGNPYDQNIPSVPDFGGPSDIGAFEAKPIKDRVFGDALGDPLSLVF